ncbi:MAG: thiamine pyrophosphate-binding protein [Alphaproteobacteria bacterium]
MRELVTVGELVAAFLESCGVGCAFGVISIHNMPILDAIARRKRTRFVPARGEAGALCMADAYARVSGKLGVGITSTGVAAGNAAGSMVEAQTAGTPLLHITGQIELAYLDRNRSYIHEARNQPDMLRAVSKAFFRVWTPESALGVLREAVRAALTPPTGPVSVEIPIDVQQAQIVLPADLKPLLVTPPYASDEAIDRLADRVAAAKRPILWLGGGARGAAAPATRLADLGFAVVTSVNGRGTVPEEHPMTLGAFNLSPAVEELYATGDLMLVVGSRLRGNETLKYTLKLPSPILQIDADPAMDGRAYRNELFVCGDARDTLERLAARIGNRMSIDPALAGDLGAARAKAHAAMYATLGPYARLVDDLMSVIPKGAPWVRDVTVSNSTWGNRMVWLSDPRQGVHALGGGIGEGLPMAIGAAMATEGRKTVALVGDGGLMMNIGELATAVQEKAEIVMILMNDLGYGVIRNIQDAYYGGRKVYADLTTPDFGLLAKSIGVAHTRVEHLDQFTTALCAALVTPGPSIVEIDMTKIGPFAKPFAGPPVRAPAEPKQ